MDMKQPKIEIQTFEIVISQLYCSEFRDEIFFRPEHVQFNGLFCRNAGYRFALAAKAWGFVSSANCQFLQKE